MTTFYVKKSQYSVFISFIETIKKCIRFDGQKKGGYKWQKNFAVETKLKEKRGGIFGGRKNADFMFRASCNKDKPN